MAQPILLMFAFFSALPLHASGEAGRVVSLTGRIIARDIAGKTPMKFLKPGDAIHEHELISTPSNGAVKLMMSDKTIVDLGGSALFKVDEFKSKGTQLGDRDVQLSLAYGKIRVVVNTPVKKGKFTVKTRSVAMGVRGTEFVVISDLQSFVSPPAAGKADSSGGSKTTDNEKTKITVIHGKVAVDTGSKSESGEKKKSVELSEGAQLNTSEKDKDGKKGEAEVTQLSKEEVKEVQKESKQEDKTFARAVEIDTSDGGGEQTMSDIISGFSLPTDLVPDLADFRLPGVFGFNLWTMNTNLIAQTRSVTAVPANSNIKVVFGP